jgi:hypothetical protein
MSKHLKLNETVEWFNRGKKQGANDKAIEELEKALKFGKKTFNFVAIYYLEERLLVLKGEK